MLRHLKIIMLAFLLVGMTAEAKEYKCDSVAGDLLQTRIYTLDNGLKVYLSVNKEKPRIQTFIAVKTGSRNDPAETTGLAHYLEHLMFKGTKLFGTTDPVKEAPYLDDIEKRYEVYRRTKDPALRRQMYHAIDSVSQLAARYFIPNEYDKLMSAIGAEGTNAYTSNDVTCYTEDIPSNEVDNWALIQADRFQNMVIRGFHTELEAVYEEYNMSLAEDNRKMWNAMYAKMFPGHPYGTQTTIGTQEHLKNPSIVNIKNYFNRYYVPNNVAICMSGDFDPNAVIATIDKYFGSWKRSGSLTFPVYAPVPDLQAPVDTTVVGKESEALMMGWKFDKASSLQADTLDVIAEILFNNKAGMLDLDLNQKMQVRYSAAFTDKLADYSQFIVYGAPLSGQSLADVRSLLLAEIEKLKRGDFSENLLPAAVNNMKLAYYTSLENNKDRADLYVDAFVTGKPWKQVAGRLDRISGMTKRQIVDFACRHFRDNYATVFKVVGADSTQRKIDKPQITAIPTNRDQQSQFVADVINTEVEPIQPRFLNYDKDIKKGKTQEGMPVLYVKNTTNGLFSLCFRYEFGAESDNWLPLLADYADYIGTETMTAEQLKQQFYKLACNVSISVGNSSTDISLSGLNENLPQAMALMEDFFANAKADKEAYKAWMGTVFKGMRDNKLNQKANYKALVNYGIYGEYNPTRNMPDSASIANEDPQRLVNLLKGMSKYQHTVLYYGPSTLRELISVIGKERKTAKRLLPVPSGKEYTEQLTPKNEIIIAPYDAKNIYMTQYHNSGVSWNPEQQAVISLFNEYFGGGMNSIVFQELRESRGLAYSAWAGYQTPQRKGHSEYARTGVISQNDKMMDCIQTFNDIVNNMPESVKALNLAKQSLRKRLAAQRVTKMGIIDSYLRAQRRGINYDLNEKVYNMLPSLSMAEIVEFEQRVMAKKPYRYLILGDEKNLDMKALEKIAPVKRVSTKDIFGY